MYPKCNYVTFGSAKPINPTENQLQSKYQFSPANKNQTSTVLPNYKYWGIITDGEEYKLIWKKNSQTYSIEHNPKRHAPNSLLIRTINKAHKIKGKITSFRVDFNDMKEVQDAYKRITKAKGLAKMLEIIKLLEKQAELKAFTRHIK